MWNYYAHTQGGETIFKWNGFHPEGNMPLLVRNEVRKGKASQRELSHGGQTPQSRHRDQMLVGDREKTSTKQPHGYLRWQMVWWVKILMNHPILNVATNVELLHTHNGERHY